MGVDQSLTQTAVVIYEVIYNHANERHIKEVVHCQVIKTKKLQDDWLIDAHARSVQVAEQIFRIADEHRPDILVVESPSLGSSGRATRTLPFLLGMILSAFTEFQHVPPSTLKKYATGSGNADKDQMVDALKEVSPQFYKDLMSMPKTTGRYDLADAYWLADYAAMNQ